MLASHFFPFPPEDSSDRRIKRVDVDYATVSPVLNPQEYAKLNTFKVYKKQAEWAAGRYAVKKLVSNVFGDALNQITLDAEPGGAPFIIGRPEHPITISHSGNIAVAALSLLPSVDIAVDIEEIEAGRMDTIQRAAFTQNEIDHVSGPDTNATFYHNWTLKEAYLKLIKKGFAESLKKVEIIDSRIFHHGKEITDLTTETTRLLNRYAFALIHRRA